MEGHKILSCKDIIKTYPNGLKALDKINIDILNGQIHAIVGENGAGKTTLMNIMYGMIKPSSGYLFLDGKRISIPHPQKAIEIGIGMVHQHFMLVPSLTVKENIVLGSERKFRNSFGKLDFKLMKSSVKSLIEKLNLPLNPDSVVGNLPIGKQQMVEILKVLYKKANFLILDEPTAVLAPNEIEDFLSFVKKLKQDGKTIIFISHHLQEVFQIADYITILRKGKNVGGFKKEETNKEKIANLMVGKEISLDTEPPKSFKEDVLLKIKDLSTKEGQLKRLNLTLNKNEILGLAGIEGNGQEELFDVLSKETFEYEGKILINDNELKEKSINEKRMMGISYITDDRLKNGLAANRTIFENGIAGHHNNLKYFHFLINKNKGVDLLKRIIDKYNVRGADDLNEKVRSLSGGNMQKILVGREIEHGPDLLVAFKPTAGVDIAARKLIHETLHKLALSGSSILLISNDMNELVNLSNRILIIFKGKIVGQFTYPDYDIKTIGYYMTGLKENSNNA
ncbi:MAG: ABC transporter ATP-binding protein [Kosmotogaceae bacterium]